MDEDGDGTITEYEFIKFMLTKSEIIDEKVLDNLHNQFTKLDVDGSGEITRQDIELRDSKVLETPTRRNDNSEQDGVRLRPPSADRTHGSMAKKPNLRLTARLHGDFTRNKTTIRKNWTHDMMSHHRTRIIQFWNITHWEHQRT